MTVIDVHTHMLTREYLDLLTRYGAPKYRRSISETGVESISSDGAPFFTLTEPMWDAALRMRDMDRAGVDMGILSLTCPNAYFGTAETSQRAARIVNDAMAELETAHPDRFRWLASLPWQHEALALAELERSLESGAVGVMVIATIDGRQLTDPAFSPIWEAIDRHALPVLVHPGPPIHSAELGLGELGLVPAAGFPFDTTLAFARMFLTGFLDRYPRLKLIASHGGGALPFLAGRLDRCHECLPGAQDRTRTRPSEYLKRIYYDAVVYGLAALKLCMEAAGSDTRVLYGSDYPHNIGDMAGCLARTGELGPAAAKRVQGANALRLFSL